MRKLAPLIILFGILSVGLFLGFIFNTIFCSSDTLVDDFISWSCTESKRRPVRFGLLLFLVVIVFPLLFGLFISSDLHKKKKLIKFRNVSPRIREIILLLKTLHPKMFSEYLWALLVSDWTGQGQVYNNQFAGCVRNTRGHILTASEIALEKINFIKLYDGKNDTNGNLGLYYAINNEDRENIRNIDDLFGGHILGNKVIELFQFECEEKIQKYISEHNVSTCATGLDLKGILTHFIELAGLFKKTSLNRLLSFTLFNTPNNEYSVKFECQVKHHAKEKRVKECITQLLAKRGVTVQQNISLTARGDTVIEPIVPVMLAIFNDLTLRQKYIAWYVSENYLFAKDVTLLHARHDRFRNAHYEYLFVC